jgi:hypothetical protein
VELKRKRAWSLFPYLVDGWERFDCGRGRKTFVGEVCLKRTAGYAGRAELLNPQKLAFKREKGDWKFIFG